MRGRIVVAVGVLGLTILTWAVAARQEGLSKFDREIAIQMLKLIREDVQKQYYDPTCRGIDMSARSTEAEAAIRASTSANEVSRILSDFLLQLKDSHTYFIPPGRSTRADYGWRMSVVGDDPYIVRVEKNSDAAAKGLQVGDRVITLNRDRPGRSNLRWLTFYYRAVRPQAQQHVVVKKLSGDERGYDVLSKVTHVSIVQLDDMIDEMQAAFEKYDQADQFATVGKDILVWRFREFADPGPVQQAIRKARGFTSLVIDLRGNPGGTVRALSELVSQTIDHPVTTVLERRRNKTQAEEVKPAKEPFTGKIVALVDSESASAAEIYARVLQIEKRGTVVGDRTAGAVMMSQMFPHAVGIGRFTFFATSITVADLRMSDGSSLETTGVQPDQVVLPTGEDLAAERDPALARAVELAGGTLSPAAAGKLFPVRAF